jgi:hypothetical protein
LLCCWGSKSMRDRTGNSSLKWGRSNTSIHPKVI